jgi:hypothetical protein
MQGRIRQLCQVGTLFLDVEGSVHVRELLPDPCFVMLSVFMCSLELICLVF